MPRVGFTVRPPVEVGKCCPVCGARNSMSGGRGMGPRLQFRCAVCHRWSAANLWHTCYYVPEYYQQRHGRRRRPPPAPAPTLGPRPAPLSPMPRMPMPGPMSRGPSPSRPPRIGDVGGFGDSTVLSPAQALPPMPAPGSADEQTQLLRRVAVAQESFNAQDLRMRYVQIAATLSIPIAAKVWQWLLGKRAARSSMTGA